VARHAVLRYVEREARIWRRLWRGSVFSGLVSPVLFLGAMGLGLGGLVDRRTTDVGGVDYLTFIAPGLLAASAMLNAAGGALWPVVSGHKWMGHYRAATATPLRPADVYAGYLGWLGIHTALHAVPYVAVAALVGGVPSPWGVLAVPVAVLAALAFAAPLAAYAVSQDSDAHFAAIMRLIVIPLFLFSGTFFPLEQLPAGLRPVAWVTPLWHGVELCRSATTGTVDPAPALLHLAMLVACIAAGAAWGVRTFTRRLALRVVERNLRAYRRIWLQLATGVFEPVLFLLSIGVGVGQLVGDLPGPGGKPLPYEQFVAPGMLAMAAMNGAIFDTTYNFFVKLKYARTYDAMLATPLSTRDVARGEVLWSLGRGALYAACFLVAMVVFDVARSWWGLLAVPVAVLIGFAFAGAGLGCTTYMRSFIDFDYVTLVVTPMFLFSATFFPLDRYPRAVELLVQGTPLYQGVALSRAVLLGDVHADLAWHVAYLAVMGWLGMLVASRRLAKLLQP
jgi:lipooligosaccharide transport system permease protein